MPEQELHSPPLSAPAGADYFSVFDLPRKLDLDEAALTRAFYRKSREVHPDRFAQAAAEKQQWSLEQTSLLNDAYRALKDPIARTEYLLRLEGVTPAEDAQAPGSLGNDAPAAQDKKNVPPELLAEVFELNMQLEEMRMNAKMGEDDPQLRKDLEQARAQFEEQLAAIEAEIRSNWQLWDGVTEITEITEIAAVPAVENKKDKKDNQQQALAIKNLASLLDKRRYVRNLVRDVREALGS